MLAPSPQFLLLLHSGSTFGGLEDTYIYILIIAIMPVMVFSKFYTCFPVCARNCHACEPSPYPSVDPQPSCTIRGRGVEGCVVVVEKKHFYHFLGVPLWPIAALK